MPDATEEKTLKRKHRREKPVPETVSRSTSTSEIKRKKKEANQEGVRNETQLILPSTMNANEKEADQEGVENGPQLILPSTISDNEIEKKPIEQLESIAITKKQSNVLLKVENAESNESFDANRVSSSSEHTNEDLRRILKSCCPMTKRYLIVSMLMLATIITYAQRMTFHLILMDYATSVPVANRSNDSSVLCTWTEMEQGVSLSIYYVGFALGLRFSCPFKSRWKIALGILLSSVATLLIAAAKSCALWEVSVFRVLTGYFTGAAIATFTSIVHAWVCFKERPWSITMIAASSHIGTSLGAVVAGALTYHSSWTTSVYTIGGIGIFSSLILILFIYDSPENHPFIESDENILIQKNIEPKDLPEVPDVPWTEIVIGRPFWAIIFGQFGHGWFISIINTLLPKYMYDVLGMRLDVIGCVQVIPWALLFVCILMLLPIVAHQMSTPLWTPHFTRVVYTTLGCVPSAAFLMMASYAGYHQWTLVLYTSLAMAFKSADYPGVRSNIYDLTDVFASKVIVVTNFASILASIIVPIVSGWLVPNRELLEWRKFFWVSVSIMGICNILFVVMCSGKKQGWSK